MNLSVMYDKKTKNRFYFTKRTCKIKTFDKACAIEIIQTTLKEKFAHESAIKEEEKGLYVLKNLEKQKHK